MTSSQSNFKKSISLSLLSIRARDFLVPLPPVSYQELIKPQISCTFIPGGTQCENRSFSSSMTWEWNTGGWKEWEMIGFLLADAQMASDTPTSHITPDISILKPQLNTAAHTCNLRPREGEAGRPGVQRQLRLHKTGSHPESHVTCLKKKKKKRKEAKGKKEN